MWDKSDTDIILLSPFLARSLLSLPMVESKNVETMSTDGNKIYWNRNFSESLTNTERDGVRVHEILHIILGHHVRKGYRDHKKWNIACDYEVNPIVISSGYDLPKDALLDRKYDDMSAEDIYDVLPNTGKHQKWGYVIANNSAEAKNKWQETMASISWGDISGNLKRKCDWILKPKRHLEDILSQYITQYISGEEETWAPPSRISTLIPSIEQIKTGHIVCCIYTSGSITAEDIKNFANHILGVSNIGQIDLILGDCQVSKIIEDVTSTDELVYSLKNSIGGGGTDFRPIIKAADLLLPDIIVYFTDGHGKFGPAPLTPCLWVMTENVKPPWGEYLDINNY